MGISRAELAHAASLGYEQYLEYQLHHTGIEDREAEAFVARAYPAVALPTAQIHTIPQDTLIATLQEATLYRRISSRRQLYERMVELWTDHFNILIDKVGVNKIEDDREVIRKHALGNFGDLVRASSHSISMLGYLDQPASRAGSPNQNYARELMELHTLGVDGGYTERDVAELSRVLTGWRYETHWGGAFVFDPAIHDRGPKRVLGLDIEASPAVDGSGIREGERVIEGLLAHPSTARFVATKILKWLLTPAPDDAQIASVARVYTETNGDIKAMIRATLRREWLREAPLKFKRPAHLVVSAVRALAPAIRGMAFVNAQVIAMGQPLFRWEDPDGYPDSAEYWEGGALARWKAVSELVLEPPDGQLDVDVEAYVTKGPEAAIDHLDAEVFGGEMPADTRQPLGAYALAGTWNDLRARETLALALSAPAFQWY